MVAKARRIFLHIITNAPFPNTLVIVTKGSNMASTAIRIATISGENPSFCSNMAMVTNIVPPGIVADISFPRDR